MFVFLLRLKPSDPCILYPKIDLEGRRKKPQQGVFYTSSTSCASDCDLQCIFYNSNSHLMLSVACDHITDVPFNNDYYIKITVYCYHSVNVITFSLAQSDHIKRLLLYYDYLFRFKGSNLRFTITSTLRS